MKMKPTFQITVVLLMSSLLCLPAYAQEFWFGNPIADFLDPATADAYHDFLVETVLPVAESAVRVFNNNPENDTGVTIYEPDRCWNGYTLLSAGGDAGHQPDPNGPLYTGILVDMEGNLVKEWAFQGAPMKMIPGGYVWGRAPLPEGGRALVLMDWDGNVVRNVNPKYTHHHDFQIEGNPVGYYAPGMEPMLEGGKTLILDRSEPDPNLTAHIAGWTLRDEVVWELDADGNVLWEWKGWHCCEQWGFDEAARDAMMTVRVGRGDTQDWLHANSASWLGPNKWYDQGDLRFHPDNVIVSLRSVNISAILARHDHPEGQWASGDVVWRVGPDYSADFPENKIGQIIGQHHSHVIPRGLPGAGNILIYDNGGRAGFGAVVPGLARGTYPNTLRDFSRVVEFNPITMDLVWEYRQEQPTEDLDGDGDVRGAERKFYSVNISGAQRLENGNTLICEGRPGRIFEVTTEGDIVWEYISPYTGPADAELPDNRVYRAYRIPASWIPQLAGN
jgi:hypothetical protein